ncbi:ATP-binding protein [Maridesulfovibrio ferrireducens]|uniref:ATP-binding protein n=1 Tax=Maridesulfovibrio ferrireducens TaxID=246191 RepID=UPI001A2284FE|nr:ATP-binding protein [Maridesulfovibrio ferrireducens]MBI9112756.1 ATP-binding protein [Maridesulfovibrio ferrireducens]
MTSITSTPKLFLAQLSIPVHRIMIRSAVKCVEQLGQILSFDETTNYNLQLAVEEATSNAVDHFSGTPGEEERIHLEFFVERDQLIISIRDKGIPFDLSQAKKYTTDNLESMSNPGLGMRLMNKGVDSVEMFVHGREGKETRLSKKLTNGALPDELRKSGPVKRSKNRETVKNSITRLSRPEELPAVCRLAWKCYGYTQEKFLYDAEALTEKVESGEFKSIITIDTDRNIIIGHIGLKYHDPAVKVPEVGLSFVDPTYRCPQVTKKLGKVALAATRYNGDLGVFDCSVTTHTFSQKAMQEHFGSAPCGLLLGIAASGIQAKELATTKQNKVSTVTHYQAFDHTLKTIYIPRHHQEMVREIYQWMKIPREFGKPNNSPLSGESSTDIVDLPDELNVSFIVINTIGETSISEITKAFQQCKDNRKDAVYAMLPTDTPSSPYLVEELEKKGFSFAGTMPHIHNGSDRITLQWLNVRLDMDAIRTYGDKTKKVFNYIKAELERIKSLQ